MTTSFDLSAFTKTTTSNKGGNSEKPKSQYWLNFGTFIGAEFVSLPYGVGLDGMGQSTWSASSSPEYVASCQARNAFLAKMLQVASQLAPGESAIILQCEGNPFAVQLLHRKSEAVADPNKIPTFDWDIKLK